MLINTARCTHIRRSLLYLAYLRGSYDQTCADWERHYYIRGLCTLDRVYPCGGAQEAGADLDCHCSGSVYLQNPLLISLTILLDLWGALVILFFYRGTKHVSKRLGARMEKLFEFFPGRWSPQPMQLGVPAQTAS